MVNKIKVLLRIKDILQDTTFLLLFSQVGIAAVAFVVNLFSTHVLDPSSRGELAFYLQLAFVVQSMVMFGTDRSFIISYPKTEASVVTKSFVRTNIFGILFTFIVSLIAGVIGSAGLEYFQFLALSFLFVSMGIFGVSIRVAFIVDRERSNKVFLVSTLLVQAILIVLAFFLFYFDIDNVFIWISIYPFSAVVYPIMSLRLMQWGKFSILPVQGRRALRSQGWRLFPLNLATFTLQKADRLLLPFLANSAELGRYVFVISILELASWPVNQWIDTQMARWRTQYQQNTVFNWGKIVALPFIGTSILAAIAGVFTYGYIKYFLGAEYQSALILIIPLCLAVIMKCYSKLFASLLIAQDKIKLTTVVEVLGLILTVCLFFLLIPTFGALGATFGLLGGSVFSLIIRIGSVSQRD